MDFSTYTKALNSYIKALNDNDFSQLPALISELDALSSQFSPEEKEKAKTIGAILNCYHQ